MWKRWMFVVVLVLLLAFLTPYSLPLIFAFLTASMLEGMVQWLSKRLRFNRLKSVAVVFIGYVLFLVVILYHFFSIVVQQTVTISEKLPSFVKEFHQTVVIPLIREWEVYSNNLPHEVIVSIENTIENSLNSVDSFANDMIQFIFNFITIIPGFLIEFLIYLIALFLFSLELPKLIAKVDEHLIDNTREKVHFVITQLNRAGIGFIKAQIILSFLTFLMAFVGLVILQVPYKAAIALLIVIVDILPILGTGSVLVPWAIISILQDNHFLGIGLIVLFVVITVIRRVIEPKVYSTNLGISPLAALISLYIGFKLFGLIGVFIGPTVVIIFDTLRKANIIKLNFKL